MHTITILKHDLDLAELADTLRQAAIHSSSSITRFGAECAIDTPTWLNHEYLLKCRCEYSEKIKTAIEHFRAQPVMPGVYVTIGGVDA